MKSIDDREIVKIIDEKQDKQTGDWIYTIEMDADIYEKLEKVLSLEGKTVSKYFEEQMIWAVEHPDEFKSMINKDKS